MALKDMALTAAEAKEQLDYCCGPADDKDGPRYPWGMSLCLGNEALDKLGVGLMPVGTELIIMAKATVTGTSSRQRQSGENTQDMDIQITAMDLNVSASDLMGKAASKLYGDS